MNEMRLGTLARKHEELGKQVAAHERTIGSHDRRLAEPSLKGGGGLLWELGRDLPYLVGPSSRLNDHEQRLTEVERRVIKPDLPPRRRPQAGY
jgi:hypothetical protein